MQGRAKYIIPQLTLAKLTSSRSIRVEHKQFQILSKLEATSLGKFILFFPKHLLGFFLNEFH